jgi:hypothetical protein
MIWKSVPPLIAIAQASFPFLRASAVVLLLTCPASAGQMPVDPASINWRQTRKVVDFMRIYGHPDSIEGQERVRFYRWKRVATMVFSDENGTGSPQNFECEVTVEVAVEGPILRVKANVANAGALAIASAGGFGQGCEKTFGFRRTKRPVVTERMKR